MKYLIALHTGWQLVDVIFLIVLPATGVIAGLAVLGRSRIKRSE